VKPTEIRPVFIGLALLLQAGCAQYFERAVLLPSADGGPGGLAFATRDQKMKAELTKPYEVLDIGYDAAKPGTTTEAEVLQRYGKIVPVPPPPPKPKIVAATPPPPPTQYTLYFLTGKTEFTPESRAVFEAAKKQIISNSAAAVVVTGHTDRVGSQKRNDALSLRRARLVRDRLIADGIPKNRIQTVGRGEREPLVKTADEVAEPKNRRVEITVR